MWQRRDLLKSLMFGGLTAMTAGLIGPQDIRAAERDVVNVTLTARPYRFSPTPDIHFDGLAYNGRIPGPLLRVRHGQRLRARLVNHTGAPSTVHWHGMILPNDMDGVPGVTQAAVADGDDFLYDFVPGPPGFRWYHSHVIPQHPLGLFGGFIVDDPSETPPDVEAVLILHDVPDMTSFHRALQGQSDARMVMPAGQTQTSSMAPSGHRPMADMPMGDEVAYLARCINGATWPRTTPIQAHVGQWVRLRLLNASPTITHYVAMGDHRLRVTHSDGNPLPAPVSVDALRIGVAERYDAWVQITRPGAWRLEAIADDGLALGQSLVIHTPGHADAPAIGPSSSLSGEDSFTYLQAGAARSAYRPADDGPVDVDTVLHLGGGQPGQAAWTINGRTWPDTLDIPIRRGNRVRIHFDNPTDMAHPMHLHGHVFDLVELNGQRLSRPLPKDTTLVPANGGSATWLFDATSPAGRWMLHCHNDIHMADGMMTAVRYV